MDMKPVPNESQVYTLLKENIKEPGRYICNPQATPEGSHLSEPVFSILYGGVGHEAAGWLMIVHFPFFLLAPFVGTLLLSFSSQHILLSYFRKVLFFTGIGFLIAFFTDFINFGIGNYPAKDALIFAIHDVILWTVIGLAVSWLMKPK